jgi:hypothetical protein
MSNLPDNAPIRRRAEEGVARPWEWSAWVGPQEVIDLLDRIDELETLLLLDVRPLLMVIVEKLKTKGVAQLLSRIDAALTPEKPTSPKSPGQGEGQRAGSPNADRPSPPAH